MQKFPFLHLRLIRAKSWTRPVNVSVKQFTHPDFLTMVEKILEETSMPINCLEIEITESLFAQDMGKVSHILEALHDKRVGVSVDDFGTGYSSLSRPLSSQAIEAILKKGDKKIKFPQEKG